MRPGQSPNEVASRVFAALDPAARAARSRLAARAGRHDDGHVRGDRRVPPARARRARRGGAAHGRLPAPVSRGDEPPRRGSRSPTRTSSRRCAPRARSRPKACRRRRIHRTGNTVVDALLEIARRDGEEPETDSVLITAHRRESFGEPLARIVRAIARLARAFPQTRFFHVVHPNPNVLAAVRANEGLPNVELLDPLDYPRLVRRLRRSRIVADRLRRDPGGGADVRKARPRPAREDGAARGRRGGAGEARRDRRGADRRRGVAAAVGSRRPAGAWPRA